MKKLLILCASLLLMTATAAFAQYPTTDTAMHHHSGMHKMKDCVVMKGGKMWMMKDGQKSEMTQTMTMSNGTMVMADGTVKNKDGKTWMMKDGEMMDMNGKVMMKDKMMKDKMKKPQSDSMK
ncbi:DUF6799 domain-containing protein [Chitinophaga sp.]|uniref:DUF6799 domain-containing protein n=1 Tax=Chitinophaga sp. TaxID=1869181 RepID=UPI0031D35F4E